MTDTWPRLPAGSAGGPSRRLVAAGAVALLMVALVFPAILNRLPLIFSDSGAYLQVAYGYAWLIDRSSFYGVLLKPFVASTDLVGWWLALLPQLIALALLIVVAAERLEARGWLGPITLLLAATTAPWHLSQLLPDAFAGVVLLLAWLCASRSPTAPGSPLLWLTLIAVVLTHSTHLAIMLSSATATLLACKIFGLSRRDLLQRVIALFLAVAAIVAIQMSANHVATGKASYSPRSNAFLYASLNEDGLIAPWLVERCPSDPRIADLCAIAPTFPTDSQKLLWSLDSPFADTIWAQDFRKSTIDWDAQLGIAVRGVVIARPLDFVRAAVPATVAQFFSFRVLDDECPSICLSWQGALQGTLATYRPHLQARVNAAPQVRGALPRPIIEAVTGLTSWVGLALLIGLLPLALRRRDAAAASLLLAVLGALLANAFVTGALSDVHDRYQSRLIYLAPLVAGLVLLRWRALRREATTPIAKPLPA